MVLPTQSTDLWAPYTKHVTTSGSTSHSRAYAGEPTGRAQKRRGGVTAVRTWPGRTRAHQRVHATNVHSWVMTRDTRSRPTSPEGERAAEIAHNRAVWAVVNERFTDAAAERQWARSGVVWGLFET